MSQVRSGQIRSRRAGISPEEAKARPFYAKVLGLQYVRPSSLLCFLFFEGTIALAVLLALAELIDWWAVLVLPLSVAAMVKLNDVIAGATAVSTQAQTRPSRRTAAMRARTAQVPLVALRPDAPEAEPAQELDQLGQERLSPAAEQRARQSANRRYE